MQAWQHHPIVAPWIAELTRWTRNLARVLAGVLAGGIGLLLLNSPAALAAPAVLEARLHQWPAWSLPAPLARPGRHDLLYPEWCAGDWLVESSDGSRYAVRFLPAPEGVVGDRAFNARAVGRALLGERLAGVANDPANPNRQIAHLRGAEGQALELESTVVGRRSERPGPGLLLVDELALQVLHSDGEPVVSRVETLSRFEQLNDGSIAVQQWQATYPSPAQGLAAPARRSERMELRLVRSPQESDRAS
jgi:hypothetical protein